MEPGGSLPFLQRPAAGLFCVPDIAIPRPHNIYLRYILVISYNKHLDPSFDLLPSGFPIRTLCFPYLP
jgi:hypothetical protein